MKFAQITETKPHINQLTVLGISILVCLVTYFIEYKADGSSAPYSHLMYFAIILSALLGNWYVSLLIAIFSGWLMSYWLMPASVSNHIMQSHFGSIFRFSAYLLISVFIKVVNDMQRERIAKYALELEEKNKEIHDYTEKLEELVIERTAEYNRANNNLICKNEELESTIRILNETQKQLIESEKMASLGSIVAGVAHEINTPLGIGITSASFIEKINNETRKKLLEGQLGKNDLKRFMEDINASINMMNMNLNRAAELIKSFKKVAVDQSNDVKLRFNLKGNIDAVIVSLKHEYKKSNHKIRNNCPSSLSIYSYPGAFSQIFTNFIMNSIKHGFKGREDGTIDISVSADRNILKIIYSDDGVGISEENLKKIYEPFFTTNRQEGNCGLGLNIVYNLVTQKLNGKIRCESNYGKGVNFIIEMPQDKI
jgi:signal transduction histidine kinase